MPELKPCPICENRKDYIFDCKRPILVPAGKGWRAECQECGLRTKIFQDGKGRTGREKAKAAWNTRYEPTCHNFGGEEGTNGEGYEFACSACGYRSDIYDPDYCPGCGSKVVE